MKTRRSNAEETPFAPHMHLDKKPTPVPSEEGSFRVGALSLLALFFLTGQALFAQNLQISLEGPPFDSQGLPYNHTSQRGLPLSTDSADPGSDGRAPTVQQQIDAGLTVNPPTVKQFQGIHIFGRAQGTGFAATPVAGMTNGTVVVKLTAVRIGSPIVARRISFLFGSVIPVPSTDENDNILPGLPEEYWLTGPHDSANSANGYYFSKHAQKVFAVRAGPIDVIWKKLAPTQTEPADFATNPEKYSLEGGNYFTLFSQRYLISGSAIKPPRTIYWSVGGYNGPAVSIPSQLVGDVHIVYNSDVPETVGETEALANHRDQPPIAFTETLTLVRQSSLNQLQAFNREGRVFVELLGDISGVGNRRVPLGFEIVDIVKEALPADITIELGDRITAYQDARDDSDLRPDPVVQGSGAGFFFKHIQSGKDVLYATRETGNLNDVLIYWLKAGEQGIEWPLRFSRYAQIWPAAESRYSHYLRPPTASAAEAAATAVALPSTYATAIPYQDPVPAPFGAQVTADLKFFTYLGSSIPEHRTLLQYTLENEVAFERVFSRLITLPSVVPTTFNDVAIVDHNNFDDADAGNKGAAAAGTVRFVHQNVEVGQRINAPVGEAGSAIGAEHLAGYLNLEIGTSYNTGTYQNPFVAGFSDANQGAIIPVNAIPGANRLEVWWFRSNGADLSKGFQTTFWPSVIGRYTIHWPANPREIVLASDDGSGPLISLEANGSVYVQNDSTLHGYNPNEEHGLMSGGQAFALRDDLNITTAGPTYSSAPFVLVDHLGSDSRPDMAIFKVLREKPDEDIVFNFQRQVPLVLQAPMPLPLMDLVVRGDGITQVNNLSEELSFTAKSDRLGVITTAQFVTALKFELVLDIDADETALTQNKWYIAVNPDDPIEQYWYYFWMLDSGKMRGFFSKVRPYALDSAAQTSTNLRLAGKRALDIESGQKVVLYDPVPGFREPGWTVGSVDPVGRTLELLNWSTSGHPWPSLALMDFSVADGDLNGWYLYEAGTENLDSAPALQNPFVYQDRKGTIWMYRGPHHDSDISGFGMRYYYKTQPGFYFPSLSTQPAVGTITPYLRAVDQTGAFVGNLTGQSQQALNIVYRPVWPSNPAVMPRGYTLTTPAFDLPAVRGQTSLEVLYQQSVHQTGASANDITVLLHDATREKQFFMAEADGSVLSEIPPSVRTVPFRGLTYFPNLPPHLSERFFFDGNRGGNGALVLRGEFVEATLGEDYLLLNALTPTDVQTIKDLSSDAPTTKAKWEAAIEGLTTTLETFVENLAVPGTFIVDQTLDQGIGVTDIAAIVSADTAVDSYSLSAVGPGNGFVTLIAGNGAAFTPQEEPVSMHVFRVSTDLHRGEIKLVLSSNPLAEKLTLQQSIDLAGKADEYDFQWLIAPPVDGTPPPTPADDLPGDGPFPSGWIVITDADGTRVTIGGRPEVRSLIDNYLVVRYRPSAAAASDPNSWSRWTTPQLAEGWIKRVLAGINPFNQRVTDLFNNTVNTSASLLEQAGQRWEGDVALNLDSVNDAGLIEIYETILRRGRSLSIDAGINFSPANDALLLAAGYLNDLYMIVGNEALADAANPTIGIAGTDVATALFSFKGQLATLLDEELALLRGRDDFLQPGVEVSPVYNRLIWNFTRGIDSGEVIYANNYNIKENQEEDLDGVINAEDAAKMFPQGHGDAYGHYLTALKGYYHLLIDSDFTWIPRTEAVTVLGKPVQVDYLDERKFAAAAAALARAGNQVFDLTWRKDFQSSDAVGWEHLAPSRENESSDTTRYWGADHWASRTGQGAYANWVVGNAALPDVDPDPSHEGIQKIDRTTVPELDELTAVLRDLQVSMDNAEAGLNPLGLSENSIPFDISPGGGVPFATGADSHFEQIYRRAIGALNNAVIAFDDAKDVTRQMRTEQDSLTDFQAALDSEELAYKNALIELYGTPYPDDIGPGKTYATGYDGPDLIHFMYVDLTAMVIPGSNPQASDTFKIDIQGHADNWTTDHRNRDFDFIVKAFRDPQSRLYQKDKQFVEVVLDSHGFFQKPSNWNSRRASPGSIQQAISGIIVARNNALSALALAQAEKYELDRMIDVFEAYVKTQDDKRDIQRGHVAAKTALELAKFANDMFGVAQDIAKDVSGAFQRTIQESLPKVLIFGLANGGDLASSARGAIEAAHRSTNLGFDFVTFARKFAFGGYETALNESIRIQTFETLDLAALNQSTREKVQDLDFKLGTVQGKKRAVNGGLQLLDDAHRKYRAELAKGIRIQGEREIARKRAAAVVQGNRTRDAALRIFRNEKLERYNTLFDLAARYAFMAAQAYDYETGLLHTQTGRRFIERIIQSRALGVVAGGAPQFAGSNTGDPGLSSALAEMKSDWNVLKGRLGFNNPDVYGTTFSLRSENYRVLPGAKGDTKWREILEKGRTYDLLQDSDVRQNSLQISRGDGLAVPGIVLEFDTTIENGFNFFGEPLAAGDHIFTPASFATKIGTVGIALEGYRGMTDPAANAAATDGSSPSDPSTSFLDPLALAATPFVYLIPVGSDIMRSPPLGDASVIRAWNVEDVIIPLPFNIGASDLSTQPYYRASDSLTEPLFAIRKHQPFRPVSNASLYDGNNGRIFPSMFTNTRLIGRSVWNTQWKLIIPGHYLLADPEEGLDRLIETLTDIKLHLETYSYSGN